MLQPLKLQRAKRSLIQLHIYSYNEDSGGLLKCLKETEVFMKEGKKPLRKLELCTKGKIHTLNYSDKGNNDIVDF